MTFLTTAVLHMKNDIKHIGAQVVTHPDISPCLKIAANSIYTDTQKYQGMMQLQDVLGGKDMNAREWNSLVSSMTPAIVKMGESLGYTSENMDEFIQTVRDGKMDNQKFINQLIKIGNEGGVLEAMAQESKDTWQAFFANVGNAASRMTAGVIQSLDEVVKALGLKDKDGKNIKVPASMTYDEWYDKYIKPTEGEKSPQKPPKAQPGKSVPVEIPAPQGADSGYTDVKIPKRGK